MHPDHRHWTRRGRAGPLAAVAILLLACALVPAVATAADSSPSGGTTILQPTDPEPSWLSRVGAAVLDAARDPEVWGPLVAAGALAATDLDAPLTEWAGETAPVFGSPAGARDASDAILRSSERVLYASTVLLAHDDDPWRWARTAGEEALVAGAATWLTRRTTDRIKRATDRERPDGVDTLSFPSGHTSSTTVRLTLVRRQADRAGLSPVAARLVDVGAATMAAACAWARVEGRKHHVTDVLAGWALGRAVGRVLHDAWFGPAGLDDAGVRVTADHAGASLRVAMRF